jgi:hypothetical protein
MVRLCTTSTSKSDRHDMTEILLKVALNTIKETDLISMAYKMIFTMILRRTSDTLIKILV